MKVLIVTVSFAPGVLDPHAVAVRDCLLQEGVVVDIFDVSGLNADQNIVFTTARATCEISVIVNGTTGSLDSYDCVWARRYCHVPDALLSPDELTWQYQHKVFPRFFRDMLCTVSTRVVNHPDHVAQAERKSVQLRLAQRLGLAIPETLITNDATLAYDFVSRHDRAVIKSLAQTVSMPGQDEVFFMTEVATLEWVAANGAGIAQAPAIFQRYIAKICEYRVTVIGSDVFAARIAAEEGSEDELDWRNYLASTAWSATRLPAAVAQKLIHFTRHLGLAYAIYDLVHGKDGEIYFLECNPNGQWLFVQELTGLPLVETFAALLTGGGPRHG